MAAQWIWWILAAVLIGVELLIGTFYLLAVGVALAFGGLLAALGASHESQLMVTGVLCVVGIVAAHHWRRRHASPPPVPSFDIGQSVRVQGWNPDGSARVNYRGSIWTAELREPGGGRSAVMYIVATRGSTLIVAEEPPAGA